MSHQITFLAPSAERQRRFFNADFSVVVRLRRQLLTPTVIFKGQKGQNDFFYFEAIFSKTVQ